MADEKKKDHAGSEGRARERVISRKVEEAQTGGETRFKRGRTGGSKLRSPKKWPAAKNPHTGTKGEPAYGTPIKD